MKKLLAALFLLPALALGAPYDLVVQQRNATDTGLAPNRFVAEPAGGANGVMGYSAADHRPIHWAVGTGLNLTAGALAISQTTGLQTALDGKFAIPTGTALQYVRGNGALATLPVARRIETYSGTTNASGQITVTYGTAYPAVPAVQPPAPAAANQVWTTVSSTTTGFTLQLNQRNTVTLLSIEVLLGATVPVNGAAATVLVVAQ